jgi:RNA-binding protein
MPAIDLTPAARKEHRAAAHHLSPVVLMGSDGLTDAIVREADLALRSHGLIKIKATGDDRVVREAMLHSLADQLSAAPIQHIGKLLVLWRPKPDVSKNVREDRGPGPKTVTLVKFSKSGNHRPRSRKCGCLAINALPLAGNSNGCAMPA